VLRLVRKVAASPAGASEADASALVAIATTHLLDRAFREPAPVAAPHLAAVELVA
jgi:hypothetical protein